MSAGSGFLSIVAVALVFLVPGPTGASTTPWSAAGAESLNVTILGFYPVTSARGIWSCAGYTAPDGHEYALVGADSLHIIDLGDPRNPRRLVVFPPAVPPSGNYYVYVAVRGEYAYVAGRYGPIKIFNLSNPQAPFLAGQIPSSEFCACSCGHPCNNPGNPYQPEIETLFIDERGILFVAGIQCGDGMHMFDLAANPTNPPWLCHEHTHPPGTNYSYYVHDVHVRDGIIYASKSRQPQNRWEILDGDPLCPQGPGPCGNGQIPQFISWFPQDGSPTHAHSAWRVVDSPFLVTCDEMENGHVRVWNVGNLTQPVKVAEFHPEETCHSIHTAVFNGRIGYGAWYNKGVQIFSLLGDPQGPGHPAGEPYRIGYYEHPDRWHNRPEDVCCDPTTGDHPCFGVPMIDPFFPSGNFIAIDIDNGLLVGRLMLDPSLVEELSRPQDQEELRVLGNPGLDDVRIVLSGRRFQRRHREPSLEIATVAGQVMRSLEPVLASPAGWFEYHWDRRDRDQREVPAGIYFLRPQGGGHLGMHGKVLVLR